MFGVGSPHYEFHRELDERFDQYRVGGCKHGQVPTNGEYGEKVEELLVEYGKSSEDAKKLSDLAREERTRWGLDEDAPMNDLPGRFNQRGQRTTAPTENDENEEKSDDGENDGLTLPELQADNVLITGIDQGLNRVNGEPVDGGDDIGDE